MTVIFASTHRDGGVAVGGDWESFCDFYESFLNKLRRSRHCIGVDLYAGKQVFISPFVNARSRATQPDTAPHQISEKPVVRIAGRNVAVGVIAVIVQRRMARIGVKDRNNLGAPSDP